jgi:hypothetical protein
MSLFPDITPLVEQIKLFTQAQQETNKILTEILSEIKTKK